MKMVGWVSIWVVGFCVFLTMPAAGQYSGGTGEPNDPYQIANVDDLLELAAEPNDYGAHFILTADINLALAEPNVFTTALIASDTDNTNNEFDGTHFSGTFDGNGHIIRNLRIDDGEAGNDYLGLFGKIKGSQAKLKDLGLENVTVTGGDGSGYLGGLCGRNDGGGISNCNVTGAINGGFGSTFLGGLCGYNVVGSISNCYATGTVDGHYIIGGLCGWNEGGSISNCYAMGAVNGEIHIGGMCGYNCNYGSIRNCYATGAVNGEDDIGGLCGCNYLGHISNCYATGAVTGGNNSYDLGGLCGHNSNGRIRNCYATGTVTGGDGSECIGGLCGNNTYYGNIRNCYATGAANGGDGIGGMCGVTQGGSIIINCYATGVVNGKDYLGGLCGYNWDGSISNCYTTGGVIGNNFLGGLVGYDSYGSYVGSFWDSNVNPGLTGVGNITDPPEVMGRTTEQMQEQSTFTDYGWDFVGEKDNGTEDIWRMCVEGVDYPQLAWEYWDNGDFVCPDGVEMRDYAYFANRWLEDNCSETNNCEGVDRDLSGAVDLTDLYLWGENWLDE